MLPRQQGARAAPNRSGCCSARKPARETEVPSDRHDGARQLQRPCWAETSVEVPRAMRTTPQSTAVIRSVRSAVQEATQKLGGAHGHRYGSRMPKQAPWETPYRSQTRQNPRTRIGRAKLNTPTLTVPKRNGRQVHPLANRRRRVPSARTLDGVQRGTPVSSLEHGLQGRAPSRRRLACDQRLRRIADTLPLQALGHHRTARLSATLVNRQASAKSRRRGPRAP